MRISVESRPVTWPQGTAEFLPQILDSCITVTQTWLTYHERDGTLGVPAIFEGRNRSEQREERFEVGNDVP